MDTISARTLKVSAGPKPHAAKRIAVPPDFMSSFSSAHGYELHSLISTENQNLPKLVMIHGALASRRYLLPTAELLARDFQVFVPEMPGHGASSRPNKALTVVQQAEVLAEYFNQKGLSNVFVFANSYGCQVAAQLTATYPELVSRLVLTGPTCDLSAPFVLQQAFRLWLDGFHEPGGAGHQLVEDLSDMSLPIAFQTAHQMVSNDIRPNLAQIACRTLLLRGMYDTLAPQKWMEEIAKNLADVRLAVIENAPHCVNYAVPAQLAKIMTEFYAEA